VDRNSDMATDLRMLGAHTQEVGRDAKALVELKSFGSNPGNLRCYIHAPAIVQPEAPLVVVLHGCSQTAAGYDTASGWSQIANDLGFVLLFPEQRRSNNLGMCFNWFEPADTARDSGEAHSIHQMIATVGSRWPIDQERIFITGFSGGGAMASAMLATYPEVFAGGAIIAGMAYGVANGTIDAFGKMHGYGLPETGVLVQKVVDASDCTGPWPTIAIWHGAADHTIDVANADAIARQWRTLHKLDEQPTRTETVDGVPHRIWSDAGGRVTLEDYIVPTMGHGTPLKLSELSAHGAAAPYMLDVGITAPLRIAQSWNLGHALQNSATPEPTG